MPDNCQRKSLNRQQLLHFIYDASYTLNLMPISIGIGPRFGRVLLVICVGILPIVEYSFYIRCDYSLRKEIDTRNDAKKHGFSRSKIPHAHRI